MFLCFPFQFNKTHLYFLRVDKKRNPKFIKKKKKITQTSPSSTPRKPQDPPSYPKRQVLFSEGRGKHTVPPHPPFNSSLFFLIPSPIRKMQMAKCGQVARGYPEHLSQPVSIFFSCHQETETHLLQRHVPFWGWHPRIRTRWTLLSVPNVVNCGFRK